MLPAVILASLLVALATALPLSRNPHWLIRGLDFPRFQLAVLAALVLLAQWLLLDYSHAWAWGLSAAVLVCLCWQLSWILPYTRLWRKEVRAASSADADRCLSILTANVLTPNRQAHKLVALVEQHQPDILVTLESDQWWEDQLACLELTMPHTIKCPLDNLYGMHVYSRLPLDETYIDFLVEDDVPSMHTRVRLRSGDWVRAHFLHPAPPSPTENPESAERDAELVVVARSIADSDQPLIVTGDLNDVAWSRTTRLFRKISGLLDPRVGRGMFNTFHARYPLLRWPLDHLFHSQHFTVANIRRMPAIGSDHFPLYSRLVFSPLKGRAQNGLESDATDQALADALKDGQAVSRADVPTPGE
ncbi:endonuclease/exonuclease/phosphatase family protein [Parahaliea aestuarii]|uniref:Endonuclease n=1 Tax=Parahaliea aestuarii TaxID=1852021 RepID=A0A5C8ZXH3_9GAMM|nr:endonuclease/exonuclease/phosphatase family protein [Parahaliea aestuarii]TXS93225.1 endonuclease [Parahaliea aestuarii]